MILVALCGMSPLTACGTAILPSSIQRIGPLVALRAMEDIQQITTLLVTVGPMDLLVTISHRASAISIR
jgi:hypothetical protein